MRTLRLACIAAEAEGLRLRHSARRAVLRLVLGLVALGFLLGAVIFCHIGVWSWLRQHWEAPWTAFILAGADLVLAALLAMLAARFSPGRIEREALAVRQRALESVTDTLTVSALAIQLLRVAVDLFRRPRA